MNLVKNPAKPISCRTPVRFEPETPETFDRCCEQCEEYSSCFRHLTSTFHQYPSILQAQRRWLPRNVDACSLRLRRCFKSTLGLFSGCWTSYSAKWSEMCFQNVWGFVWGIPFAAAQALTKLALAAACLSLQLRPAVSCAKMRWGVFHHSLNELEWLFRCEQNNKNGHHARFVNPCDLLRYRYPFPTPGWLIEGGNPQFFATNRWTMAKGAQNGNSIFPSGHHFWRAGQPNY